MKTRVKALQPLLGMGTDRVRMFPTFVSHLLAACSTLANLSAMADCAPMATVQSWFSLRPCPPLTSSSGRTEVRFASRIRVILNSSCNTRDVELLRHKNWTQHLWSRTGIGLGLSYSPWRILGSEKELVESHNILAGKFLILSGEVLQCECEWKHGVVDEVLGYQSSRCRTAFLTEAGVGWKWMLAVAMAISINFTPWNADFASALEGSQCDDVAQYYSQASDLKGANLKAKLHEIVAGHKQLSYAQVWNALKILDAADPESPDTSPDIVDIYSLKRLPKSLQGDAEGWNREHLWPRSYGLMEGRPEFTDVHNLRPADVNVNSSRGNKYFGDCTSLKTTRCLIPANKEAGADTATDVNTWRPPSQVRGDIARAVFYMAVRYGIEQPSGNLNLQLSDSPSVAKATMGLLSTLLEWNNVDPPSASEVLRNARVCSLYQGNRNPFVDHPEYASRIWATRSETTAGNANQLPKAWINSEETLDPVGEQ